MVFYHVLVRERASELSILVDSFLSVSASVNVV